MTKRARQALTAVALLLAVLPAVGGGRQRLVEDLVRIISSDHIGVGLIFDDGDTIGLDGNKPFPMMSVAKFHQALALAHKKGYPGIMTDSATLTPSDLPGGTWSPLRASHPGGATLGLPTMLYYSLGMSDNNVSDYIFGHLVSCRETDSIIRLTTPARDFAIRHTEAEMHADTTLARLNYTTPLDAARLFDHFFTTDTTAAGVVVRAVMSTPTALGADRICGGIPAGRAMVFHKTGTGFERPDGGITALADVAHVCYVRPDGTTGWYTLAVFIRDFAGTAAEAAERISAISAAVWCATVATRVDDMNSMASVGPAVRRPGQTAEKGETLASVVGDVIFEAVLESIFGDN